MHLKQSQQSNLITKAKMGVVQHKPLTLSLCFWFVSPALSASLTDLPSSLRFAPVSGLIRSRTRNIQSEVLELGYMVSQAH